MDRLLVVSVVMHIAVTSAVASPFANPSYGDSVFTGPVHSHATSLHVNPAALGRASEGHHFFFGGGLRLDQLRVERNIVDPATGNQSRGPTLSTTTITPTGLAAYYGRFDRVAVGVALSNPSGQEFLKQQAPARYHIFGGDYYLYSLTIGASFLVNDRLIIGGSIALTAHTFDFNFSRDTVLDGGSSPENGIAADCGGEPCGFEHPDAREDLRIDAASDGVKPFSLLDLVSTKHLAYVVGGMLRLSSSWWFAASWERPVPNPTLTGDLRILTAPRDGATFIDGEAEVSFKLPSTWRVGVRGTLFPNHDLVLMAKWQRLSTHKRLDFRFLGSDLPPELPEWSPRYRGFSDVLQFAAGIERSVGATLRYGGRLRAETAAAANSLATPLQVENRNVTLGGAVEWRFAQAFAIQLGYEITWHPEIDATNNSFNPLDQVRCTDSGFELDECEATSKGQAIPTAAGQYRRWRHGLSFSLRYDPL